MTSKRLSHVASMQILKALKPSRGCSILHAAPPLAAIGTLSHALQLLSRALIWGRRSTAASCQPLALQKLWLSALSTPGSIVSKMMCRRQRSSQWPPVCRSRQPVQYRLGYLLASGAQLAKLAIDMMPASPERLDWPKWTWSRIDPLLDG